MKEKLKTLRWQILRIIMLGWFLPLAVAAFVFMVIVTSRMDIQAKRTVTTSMEKAAEVCAYRLSSCVAASKEASYQTVIKDAYDEYLLSRDKKALKDDVTGFLERQYKYNESFDLTVLIFTDEDETLYYTGNSTGRGSNSRLKYFRSDIKDFVLEKSAEIDTDMYFFASNGHVYMMRNMMDRTFTPFAVIVMELNSESIFESLKSVWAYRGMSIWYQGSLLDEMDAGSDVSADAANNISRGKTYFSGEDKICYLDRERYGDFMYAVSLDRRAINVERSASQAVFAFLLVFVVLLFIQVLHFFQKRISAPISRLSDASKQIAEGKYGTKVEEPVSRVGGEIAELTENFNLMSEKLAEQFNRIFVEEIALRDANIHALQSQINPHFLNNTLEIINWEARLKGDDKVSRMIEALSVMMSATMDRHRQSIIPLEEELEYVHAFIYIIECRFSDKFTYSEDIDDTLLGVKVPRLIIQPVIENAVEHGGTDDGRIDVRLKIYGTATADETDIKIEIINPGEPSEEDSRKINELLSSVDWIDPTEERSTRIGIRNVHRRLKILYGENSGLTIEPDGNGNTKSTIFVKN